jgi:hypothetical protein
VFFDTAGPDQNEPIHGSDRVRMWRDVGDLRVIDRDHEGCSRETTPD